MDDDPGPGVGLGSWDPLGGHRIVPFVRRARRNHRMPLRLGDEGRRSRRDWRHREESVLVVKRGPAEIRRGHRINDDALAGLRLAADEEEQTSKNERKIRFSHPWPQSKKRVIRRQLCVCRWPAMALRAERGPKSEVRKILEQSGKEHKSCIGHQLVFPVEQAAKTVKLRKISTKARPVGISKMRKENPRRTRMNTNRIESKTAGPALSSVLKQVTATPNFPLRVHSCSSWIVLQRSSVNDSRLVAYPQFRAGSSSTGLASHCTTAAG